VNKFGHILLGGGPGSGRYPAGSGGQADVSLKPVASSVFGGQPVALKTKLSKQAAGALGERIGIAYLKSQGINDAHGLNTKTPNFPVDLIGDHQLVEVKTGLVSNGASAQQWRATIGQPGEAEQAWLKTASSSDKASWNRQKQAAILQRKSAVLSSYRKQLGQDVKGRTLTTILNPDKKTVDVFVFNGFHSRIAWNSDAAKAAYKGTYAYA
jgi:hypothetical protein